MAQIPDYTNKECAIIKSTMDKHWKKQIIGAQLADAEMKINSKHRLIMNTRAVAHSLKIQVQLNYNLLISITI